MSDPDTPRRVLGYGRVSTDEQVGSGYGLAAQRHTLADETARRGWTLLDVVMDEGASGRDLDRPGIRSVLERLVAGEADVLMVAKLDRLTRSLVNLAEVLDWADRVGVAIVAVDLGIDTTTSAGRLVARVMASVAEWEREQISARTREAAAVRRREGGTMGRPGVNDSRPEVAARIRAERTEGKSFAAIAAGLNADGIATVRGAGQWRVSSVQSAAGYVRPPSKARRVALPEPRKRQRTRPRRSAIGDAS